eukprot:scaffold20821_cov47-Attheya_sp.AAC.1
MHQPPEEESPEEHASHSLEWLILGTCSKKITTTVRIARILILHSPKTRRFVRLAVANEKHAKGAIHSSFLIFSRSHHTHKNRLHQATTSQLDQITVADSENKHNRITMICQSVENDDVKNEASGKMLVDDNVKQSLTGTTRTDMEQQQKLATQPASAIREADTGRGIPQQDDHNCLSQSDMDEEEQRMKATIQDVMAIGQQGWGEDYREEESNEQDDASNWMW